MPLSVDVNPLVPPGSESLKLGPSRFQAIEQAILKLFGFDGTTEQTWLAPFTMANPADGLLSVVGPPIDPLGIATMAYVQQRTLYATISSSTGALYVGNPDPPIDDYQTGVVYVLRCVGIDSILSPLMLQLGNASSGAKTVTLSDGVVRPTLPVGTFTTGSVYFVIFDGTNLRIMGSNIMPLPVVLLAGNPVVGSANDVLQATPKQYVDAIFTHPVVTVQPHDVEVFTSAIDIWTASITTPNDGNSYLLYANYVMNFFNNGGATGDMPVLYGWLNDGSNDFGSAGGVGIRQATGEPATGAIAAGVFSPNVYAANTTITITVKSQSSVGTGDASKHLFATVNSGAGGAPPSSITLTLFRTSP